MTIEQLEKIQSQIPLSELIDKAKIWIEKLCKSGGDAWSLRVPPNPKHDPDLIFLELCNRLEYLSKRCQAAENYIDASPCDPDITDAQIEAYRDWKEIVKQDPSVFF